MSTFNLPVKCCSCLGPKEMFKKVSKEFGLGTIQQTTYTLDVPVCKSCAKKMDKVNIMGITIRVIIIFLGFSIGLGVMDSNETAGIISIIGSIIGSHIIVTLYKKKNFPVQIDQSGNVSFTNKDYQILFVDANPKNRTI